ncbi:LysR substrate-binding domain-containing protein [Psychrobacillus sp. NPDC096426]|uniref:LysR substrate-binding domain-containing protein n=1 Tax=Psychrobacillus sp. NPDC096426 TaxID=3364491 RepID=UPI0038169E8C
MPQKHPLASSESIDLSLLAEAKFIGITTDYGFRNLVDSFCTEVGFIPNYVCEMEESSVIQELIKLLPINIGESFFLIYCS